MIESSGTSKKLGTFLLPHRTTVLVFMLLMLLMPVFYVYSEPERTNYRIGEEQHWLTKTRIYESPLGEYLFHTDGNFDVFLGIIERDYVNNYIGFLLLALYYIIACVVNRIVERTGNFLKVKK